MRGIVRLAWWSGACFLAAAACSESDVPSIPANAEAYAEGAVDTLAYRAYSGIDEPRRQVVRDSDAWAAAWTALNGTLQPPPELPEVDFERDMVLLVASGSRSTGGYGIGVLSVQRSDEGLHVEVEERSPGPRCVTTQAITAPAAAVRVPAADGEVSFVDRETVRDCE